MKTTIFMAVCVLLVLALVACAPQVIVPGAPGAGNVLNIKYAVVSEGTLNGQSTIAFANQTTSWLNMGQSSELTVWLNCTGNVNVSTVTMQYAMDPRLVQNVSMTPCYNNLTKYDVTNLGTGYVRFDLKGNMSDTNETLDIGRVVLLVGGR